MIKLRRSLLGGSGKNGPGAGEEIRLERQRGKAQ